MKSIVLLYSTLAAHPTSTMVVGAFSSTPQSCFGVRHGRSETTALSMGLFDGVKDAFSAPPASAVDSERETPIDRWMGWNVKPMDDGSAAIAQRDDNFVDSMDGVNYITAHLGKPMGIVFEENDEEYGGIFVLSLTEGGIAESDGTVKPGDQLVAVNRSKVAGFAFDPALGEIVASEEEKTKLVLFRGTQEELYGPTGASQEWLDDFVAKEGGEDAASS